MHRITLGRLAASVLVVAVIVGTSAATSAVVVPPRAKAAVRAAATTAHAPVPSGLMAFGGRSAAQQRSGVGAKLDAALAGIARHTDRTTLVDLGSLNPAARFMVSPRTGTAYVAVDAITRGDPRALRAALLNLGLEHPAVYRNDVGGWLPLGAINAAAALSELHSMRAAMSRTNSGSVTTQGDYAQGTQGARTGNGLDGSGVTVGIISDSYNCYATYASNGVMATGNFGYASNTFTAAASSDITSADLPAGTSINILEEAPCLQYDATNNLPWADEGRAMMQVVHDVAPGAKLAFHTAVLSEADFASGIQALASAGAKVIADDVTYFDEPFFQDGIVAQAVDTVKAAGVAYFAAAGNSGANAYDNTNPSFATPSTSPAGEMLLNFDTSGATTQTTPILHIPVLVPGEYIAIVLQWDQPYVTGAPGSPGATSQLDLCVTSTKTGLIASPDNPNDPNSTAPPLNVGATQVCTGANNTGTDPYQILVLGYPATATGGVCPPPPAGSPPQPFNPTSCSAAQDLTLQVGLKGGGAPGRIKLAIEDNGAGTTGTGLTLTGGTLQGHPGAAGAMAVGAAWWDNTPACQQLTASLLETYSAKGGDPILFDATGARLTTPVTRQKPDIVGPDGGSNTFLGFIDGPVGSGQCLDTGTLPAFFGTSAATPHVAAAAALMLQKNPALAPDTLYNTLRSTATAVANDTTGAIPGINYAGGYGFIDAQAAVTGVVSAQAPVVNASLNPTTIDTGGTSTYTWSVTNASGCTASGAWSGTQPLSGNMMVTQSTAGSYDYTLTCVNDGGQTIDTEVLTVVTSGGGGGGGGGALDLLALFALAGLTGARLRRRAP